MLHAKRGPANQHEAPVAVQDGTLPLRPAHPRQARGLGEAPGNQAAWNLFPHGGLTAEAIQQVTRDLPGELAEAICWLDSRWNVPSRVLTRRRWQIGSPGQHFLRAAGQSQEEAYRVAVRWILNQGAVGAELLGDWLALPPSLRSSQGALGDAISACVGAAVQALVDSFSPARVQRVPHGGLLVISALEGYAGQAQPDFALLEETAVEATRVLLGCVLTAAGTMRPKAQFRNLAEERLVQRYLVAAFSLARA
jgi:hypothetical protein